jgi:hypothetical protein
MGYIRTYRPRPEPAPIHTCEEPEPLFLEVPRPELNTAAPAKKTVVVELIPFGSWTPEEVYFHCLRRKAENCLGYYQNQYQLDAGRVLQITTRRNTRDQ